MYFTSQFDDVAIHEVISNVPDLALVIESVQSEAAPARLEPVFCVATTMVESLAGRTPVAVTVSPLLYWVTAVEQPATISSAGGMPWCADT